LLAKLGSNAKPNEAALAYHADRACDVEERHRQKLTGGKIENANGAIELCNEQPAGIPGGDEAKTAPPKARDDTRCRDRCDLTCGPFGIKSVDEIVARSAYANVRTIVAGYQGHVWHSALLRANPERRNPSKAH